MILIPADVAEALNVQMGREFGAHVQYLAISAWFDDQGLPELSQFFYDQANEEHDHALKMYDYLRETGAPVAIPAIGAPKPSFESADEAVGLALDQEWAVTRWINELVDLAVAQKDHATRTFLQWFVTEQVEEVATMTELRQIVQRAGEGNLLMVEDYVARKLSSGGTHGGGAA